MIHLARILLLLLVTVIAQAQEESAAIEVKILQIENAKGQILIELYDSKDSWLKKPAKGVFGKIIDGQSGTNFTNIPDGTYTISVYPNEDNDGYDFRHTYGRYGKLE